MRRVGVVAAIVMLGCGLVVAPAGAAKRITANGAFVCVAGGKVQFNPPLRTGAVTASSVKLIMDAGCRRPDAIIGFFAGRPVVSGTLATGSCAAWLAADLPLAGKIVWRTKSPGVHFVASKVAWTTTTTVTASPDPVTVRVPDTTVTSGSFAGQTLRAVLVTNSSLDAMNAACASSKGLKKVELAPTADGLTIDP
jgi:hypothetical protein